MNSQLVEDGFAICRAGIDAVDPIRLMRDATEVHGKTLRIGESEFELSGDERLIVVGAGKAASRMTVGLLRMLPQSWLNSKRVFGWVNVPEGTVPAGYAGPVQLFEARPYGRNEPTEKAFDGTQRILDLVRSARPQDIVVCLLSGGASALLPCPAGKISLSEKLWVTRVMSENGASIDELNLVRRHLSRIKGGGLARACSARNLVCLVISDVLGDNLQTIGSGPAVLECEPRWSEVKELLDQYRGDAPLPGSVHEWIEEQSRLAKAGRSGGFSSESKKQFADVTHYVLANNATAVDACGTEAVRLGYRYLMNSANRSEGAAEDLGRHLLDTMLSWHGDSSPDCLISGGEPTVSLPSVERRGVGGRNQQLVLAALESYLERGFAGRGQVEIFFMSAGTDGEDGPTDAAGAWFVTSQLENMEFPKGVIRESLLRCDAYRFFEEAGLLYKTGATGTNVCDLRIGLFRRR